MTSTEEIVVSGEDFIERRIFVYPEPGEMNNLRQRAYARGYSRGRLLGFLMGTAVIGVAVFCFWLAVRY
jgi:hypothetical protein